MVLSNVGDRASVLHDLAGSISPNRPLPRIPTSVSGSANRIHGSAPPGAEVAAPRSDVNARIASRPRLTSRASEGSPRDATTMRPCRGTVEKNRRDSAGASARPSGIMPRNGIAITRGTAALCDRQRYFVMRIVKNVSALCYRRGEIKRERTRRRRRWEGEGEGEGAPAPGISVSRASAVSRCWRRFASTAVTSWRWFIKRSNP